MGSGDPGQDREPANQGKRAGDVAFDDGDGLDEPEHLGSDELAAGRYVTRHGSTALAGHGAATLGVVGGTEHEPGVAHHLSGGHPEVRIGFITARRPAGELRDRAWRRCAEHDLPHRLRRVYR